MYLNGGSCWFCDGCAIDNSETIYPVSRKGEGAEQAPLGHRSPPQLPTFHQHEEKGDGRLLPRRFADAPTHEMRKNCQ